MNDLILKYMDEAIKIIDNSKNIFIASHINPDGDNIGSSLSLALALSKLNKNVTVLIADDIPDDYTFLPGIDLFKDYDESLGQIDLFIAVDSSDIDRLGKNKDLLNKSEKIINIDHHISNTKFGHINIVDHQLAATGELIYYLIKRMGINLDKEIATNIYTAINTDTGRFSYESVSSNTHRIAAELIDAGIDIKFINFKLYESSSIERTNLFISALTNLNTYSNSRIATVKVSQKMLEETKTNINDTEGIVSFIRSIESVEVSCLLKEISSNEIKISLRSKEYVNVASICEKFDGGGHVRAAGCTIFDDLDSAETKIIEEIMKNLGDSNERSN
ncbi:MAG: bifunctional oligoribonuclease/PAP phosphatase NrnA [Tissierellaceae bacterium]|nr:bifunctional oligoribonuclease/PAP phosphatase NrnA [Tissierellaceae bacterium]